MSGSGASVTGPGINAGRVRLVPKSSPLSWVAMAVSAVALTLAAYAIARVSLVACGYGLFGLAYSNCPETPAPIVQPVDEEAERAAALEAESEQLERQLRQVRAAIAQTPNCPVPPPLRRAEAPPPPTPPVQEALKLPRTTAELKGCWQSDRGDIQLTSDDESRRPTGNVRICYCFGDTGNGSITLVYTDQVVCRGQISATVTGQELTIDRPQFNCGSQGGLTRGLVKARTTCRANADQNLGALCDTETMGRTRGTSRDEKYHRIASDRCAMSGG